MNRREIQVFADWAGLGGPALMGYLYADRIRGKEVFSFEYAKEWLANGFSQVLDPDLQYYSGPQYLREEKPNFGLFMDSSPDRWGRLLMSRREALLARKEKRRENPLYETDFLLGVFDGHRMGGLRFKEAGDGPFLNDNKEFASPPWTSLRELEYASLQLEKDDSSQDPKYARWLAMLVAPGSSLGGARPKAGVLDNFQQPWIAKYPSRRDDKDMGAWEMVAHDLAKAAGINMATGMILKFSGEAHTYLTRRFDRTNAGDRLHFASAMTLLGQSDGNDHHDQLSYLHIAEFIMQQGAAPTEDLQELWRRIAFSICISNVDDHLRNHGFMLTQLGWKLSPAYDINPSEYGNGLTLNISETDNSLDPDLVISVAPYFRINKDDAAVQFQEIFKAVQDWRKVAQHYGISRNEQEMMDSAFKTF